MECCSSGCAKAGTQVEAVSEPGIMAAAENLALLLARTVEYQAFARASRAVQFDAEVGNISNRLNGYASFDAGDAPESENTLRECLEALPVVQEYRRAETAIRALFGAVDDAISASAGVDFAVNAVASGCG